MPRVSCSCGYRAEHEDIKKLAKQVRRDGGLLDLFFLKWKRIPFFCPNCMERQEVIP